MALLILIFLITNVLWYFLMEHIFLFVLGKLQSPISYDIHIQIFDIHYQNNEYFVKYHLADITNTILYV